MKIKLLGFETALPDSTKSADAVMEQIEKLLADGQMVLERLLIDGNVIEADYETFIAANLPDIKVIEVCGQPRLQFIYEQLQEGLTYLERALPEIEPLADEFYQGSSSGTWEKFDLLLEGLQWLAQLTHTAQHPELAAGGADYRKISLEMLQKLGELGSALQVMDQVLIADLIKYEIYPLLEAFHRQLQKTLQTWEHNHDERN